MEHGGPVRDDGAVRFRVSVLRGDDFVPSTGTRPLRATFVRIFERGVRHKRAMGGAAMRTAASASTLSPAWNEYVGTVAARGVRDTVELRVYYDGGDAAASGGAPNELMGTTTLRVGALAETLRCASEWGAVVPGTRRVVHLPIELCAALARVHGGARRGELVVALVVAEASRGSLLDVAARRVARERSVEV